MKKLLIILAVIILAACKEKPKPMAFSNDTNKAVIHGFYYDSTTNTLRAAKDTAKLSTNISQSRIITRGGKSAAWIGIKPDSTANKRRFSKLFNSIPEGTRFIFDTPRYSSVTMKINKTEPLTTHRYLDSIIRLKYPMWPYVLDGIPQAQPSEAYLDSLGYFDMFAADNYCYLFFASIEPDTAYFHISNQKPPANANFYNVIIDGTNGYAAYQKCDTCSLVVLDSAATINTLFYHLMRQYKIHQSQLK